MAAPIQALPYRFTRAVGHRMYRVRSALRA